MLSNNFEPLRIIYRSSPFDKKNATINPKTNNDKGSYYTVTVALNHKKLHKKYKKLSLL